MSEKNNQPDEVDGLCDETQVNNLTDSDSQEQDITTNIVEPVNPGLNNEIQALQQNETNVSANYVEPTHIGQVNLTQTLKQKEQDVSANYVEPTQVGQVDITETLKQTKSDVSANSVEQTQIGQINKMQEVHNKTYPDVAANYVEPIQIGQINGRQVNRGTDSGSPESVDLAGEVELVQTELSTITNAHIVPNSGSLKQIDSVKEIEPVHAGLSRSSESVDQDELIKHGLNNGTQIPTSSISPELIILGDQVECKKVYSDEHSQDQTMDLKIVSVESKSVIDCDEGNKSDEEDELVIDLEDTKKTEVELSVLEKSSNFEGSKLELSNEKNDEIDEKSVGTSVVCNNLNMRNSDQIVEEEKENKHDIANENDETVSSFEKLEKSLRELRESLSMENEDRNAEKVEVDLFQKNECILKHTEQSSSFQKEQSSNVEPGNNRNKQQDEEKQLEEEMESLLNEFRETTNKTISVVETDFTTTCKESIKPSILVSDDIGLTNHSMDSSENCPKGLTTSDIAKDTNVDDSVKSLPKQDSINKNETTGNSLCNVNGNMQTISKDLSATNLLNAATADTGSLNRLDEVSAKDVTSSGSDKNSRVQPKQKLYDSNELWSKMGMNRCTSCNFTTDDESFFQQHTCSKKSKKDIVLRFKEDQYHCETCLYTSNSKKKFEEHLAFHLLSHPFICLECKTTFETKSDIEVHVKNKHPHETVRCGLRASKKINEIIDNLHRNSFYRFAGRIIDAKSLISIMQSRDQKLETIQTTEKQSDTSLLTPAVQSKICSVESSKDSDSSESVVIYLSDTSTGVVSGNNVTNAQMGQPSVTNIVASNKPSEKPAKVPISKSLKMHVYPGPIKSTPQTKPTITYPSYVTNNGPVLLIPVSMPSNVMGVGLPQSPTAVNVTQRIGNISNTVLATAAVQQGTSTAHISSRGLSVLGQQNIPTSPLATATRVPGGQFFNLSQAVQQSPLVNQSVIGNAQGTRLILVPESTSHVQAASNQVFSANIGLANIVGNVAATQPIINSTVLPLVGQAVVSQNSASLSSITTTSAPPPSYEETIKNKQQTVPVTNKNWTSILNKQLFSVQNNVYGTNVPQCSGALNNSSSSSPIQMTGSVVTGVPTQAAASTSTANVAKRTNPNTVTVNKVNAPILPKTLSSELSSSTGNAYGGVLATSMVMTEGNKDGTNKLFFRKSGGMYTCEYCHKDTVSEDKFKEHIWRHFHEIQVICKHCSVQKYDASYKCSLVERVMTGLRCAAARQNLSSEAENKSSDSNVSESVVILSDDDEDGEASSRKILDKADENMSTMVPVEVLKSPVVDRTVPVDNDGGADRSDVSVIETQPESTTDNDQSGSELNLKITSIVSLHVPDDPFSSVENGKEKLSGNVEFNEDDNFVNEATAETLKTNKKKGIQETGNIFDKIAGETMLNSETSEDNHKEMILSSKDMQSKQQNSETSEDNHKETILSSKDMQTKTTYLVKNSQETSKIAELDGNVNSPSTLDNVRKETDDISSSDLKKENPTYNFGGSFYVCGFEDCSFKCMTSPEFRDHLTNFHSGASDFVCAHCGHKSFTEESYLRHMFVHSNAKSFVLFLCKCGGCKFGTNLINLFKEHLTKSHPSESSYKCSSCCELFLSIGELVSHVQSNLLKFVQCPYCTVKDRNRKIILAHISHIHPGKAKQITVTSQLICQERESNAYVAPNQKPLTATVQPETGSKPVTSDNNVYPFKPSTIKQEPEETLLETVSGIIDNAFYNISDKKSSSTPRASKEIPKSVLKSSNSSHSLVKCPSCTYIANGKGFLKKHLKVHDKGVSKQRPFMCPYCPGEADTQSKFISHVGLHCGNQKPNGTFKAQIFYCSHCSFQSNLLGKVFNHGERAHANFRKETDYTTSTVKIKSRSFMCDLCLFYTREKEEYDKHVEQHKNGDIPDSSAPLQSSDTLAEQPQPQASAAAISENHPNMLAEGNVGNESRRFCCKECEKTFKRLPHLKQHLSVHIKDEPYQLTFFRCSYCGFSSTSKLWISRHTEEKHPGKLIRIKRRVESVSSAKTDNQPAHVTDSPRVSIDTYHCDCCAFSCSDREDLIRHTKLHFVTSSETKNDVSQKLEKPAKKPYDGPTEPFIIPAGNVYKHPINCTKCSFSTKLRLELLRHVKMHPMLIPESEQSPRKEVNPSEKGKLLVKTTFLKRRFSHSPDFKQRTPKKKRVERLESSTDDDEDEEMKLHYDDVDDDGDDNDDDVDKETEQVSKTSKKELIKSDLSKGSLYFLGGDLLHNKLKPCYSEETERAEFTCLYCGSLLEEKYPLHKHLLQHMDVSFYKCAYCDFGALEVTPIMIHIQREHRKPIKHIQQNVKDVESKINKSIHEMKAKHYLGVDSKSNNKQESTEGVNVKLEPQEANESHGTPIIPTTVFKTRTSSSSSHEISPRKSTSPKLGTHVKKFGMLYKCRICGYTSHSKATINRHGVVHTSFKRYECPYCIYRSHWKPDVLKHVVNVHAGEEVKAITHAAQDALTITSPTSYAVSAEEMNEKMDDWSESAKENDASALTSQQVEDQQKAIVVGFSSSFKCNICLAKFKSKWAIHKHFRTSKCGEIPMFGCSSCKFKNVGDEAVIEHIKTKHPFSTNARVTTLGRASKFRIHKIPVRKLESKDQKIENRTESNQFESLTYSVGEKPTFTQMKIERTRERNGLIKKVGNLYKCKVCSFRGQRSNVSRHLSTHSQLIKHSCPFCEYKSNWNFNIKRHVLKYHGEKNLDLKVFDKTGPKMNVYMNVEKRPLKNNNVSENENASCEASVTKKEEPIQNTLFRTKFRCLVCNNIKLSISGMYRHLRSDGCNEPMFGCSACSFKSMLKEKVNNHIDEKHPDQDASPSVLNIAAKIKKIRSKVKSENDYMGKKEEPLEFSRNRKPIEVKCPSCHYISPSRKVYQEHFDKSHKGMFLACTQCAYKTQLMMYLYKHTVKVHNTRDVQFEIHRKKMRNKDVRFQCPKCDHQAKKPNMRAHLYFHLDYRPINCGHCRYKTRKQMIAKKHILSNHPGLPLKIIVKQDKQVEAEIDQLLSSMKVAESDLQQHTTSDVEIKERKKMHCEYEKCDFKCIKSKTMKIHIEVVHSKVEEDNSNQDVTSDTKIENKEHIPKKSPEKMKNVKESLSDIDPDIFSPRKNYTTSYNARLHKQVFKCKHCSYVASVKKSMVSHYYHHVPPVFKCPYCDYQNYPRSRVIQHMNTNHATKDLYIVDLRTDLATSVAMDTSRTISPDSKSKSNSPHKKSRSEKGPTPPKKAKKEKRKFVSIGLYSDIFTSEGSSDENEEDDKNSKSVKTGLSKKKDPSKITYCCNFCNYRSTVFYHYRQHLAAHGGFKWQTSGTIIESRLKCGMCSFLAVNDEEFKEHMEKHLNTRPFICPYCDFSAFLTSSVKKHVQYRHPSKPVKANKNKNSGDLVVAEGGPQMNIRLVEMEPKVKLYDIFSMESEDFEQLLTDAEVSVIDLQYIPDEKFDIVSKTLGFSSEDIMELEELYSDNDDSSAENEEDTSKETMVDKTDRKDESKFDDSFVSTESMETVDEISDSITEEKKTISPETEDIVRNKTEENAYEDLSDIEEDSQVSAIKNDFKGVVESTKTDGKDDDQWYKEKATLKEDNMKSAKENQDTDILVNENNSQEKQYKEGETKLDYTVKDTGWQDIADSELMDASDDNLAKSQNVLHQM